MVDGQTFDATRAEPEHDGSYELRGAIISLIGRSFAYKLLQRMNFSRASDKFVVLGANFYHKL
jgi:hypothetical protein